MTGIWQSLRSEFKMIVESPWHGMWTCCWLNAKGEMLEPFIASTEFIDKHFKRCA